MSSQPDVLEQLIATLNGVPEPGDMIQRTQVTALKLQAKIAVQLLQIPVSIDEKRKTLATCQQTLNLVAGTLGGEHPAVKIAFCVLMVVEARIEGRPDPVSISPTGSGLSDVGLPDLRKQGRAALLLGGPPAAALALIIVLFVGRSIWRSATASSQVADASSSHIDFKGTQPAPSPSEAAAASTGFAPGQDPSSVWLAEQEAKYRREQMAIHLTNFGVSYHHRHDTFGRGSQGWHEVDTYGVNMRQWLEEEGYVIHWGLKFAEVTIGTSNFILAYPKKASTDGGQVLMLDGSVRTVTAQEFKNLWAYQQSAMPASGSGQVASSSTESPPPRESPAPAPSPTSPRPPAPIVSGSDEEKLQGRWRVTSLTVEGQTVPGASVAFQLEFSGDQATFIGPTETPPKPFRLHPRENPKRIEFEAPGQSGIYELSGDTLRLCNSSMPQGTLPTMLRADVGDGTVLMVLERVK